MPFTEVPTKVDFPAQERELLKFWEDSAAFRKLTQVHANDPHWSFIDGPITANNPMGAHHGWGRTYKDLYHRFWTMRGRKTRYQNGFDCQGLWVEVEVEKEMGFKSKKDIEAYGLERFVRKCKARVLRSPRCRPNSPSAWAIGWTGTTPACCASWPTCWKTIPCR
jgi:isoleucyl-tRNA synthetase